MSCGFPVQIHPCCRLSGGVYLYERGDRLVVRTPGVHGHYRQRGHRPPASTAGQGHESGVTQWANRTPSKLTRRANLPVAS
jgi:hypothetical protein